MPLKITPEQAEALAHLQTVILEKIMAKQGWHKTCLSCAHFNESTEQCTKWLQSHGTAMRPPARVIVEGCPSWEFGRPY